MRGRESCANAFAYTSADDMHPDYVIDLLGLARGVPVKDTFSMLPAFEIPPDVLYSRETTGC